MQYKAITLVHRGKFVGAGDWPKRKVTKAKESAHVVIRHRIERCQGP
jgi:hypothetical protein